MADYTNKQIDEVIKGELKDISHITDILTKNINRSLRLLRESMKLAEHSDNLPNFLEYYYDVIRATIVFLHSALETALREIVRLNLMDRVDLSYIPLYGQSSFRNRKEKFSLEELAKYRGKSVDEVISNSIDEYLNTLSFNHSRDITDTFARLDLQQSSLQKYYPELDEMISRRHQIVHEADLKRNLKSTELEPVKMEKIQVWVDTTADFCTEVIRLTFRKVYVAKIEQRLNELGITMSSEDIERSVSFDVNDKAYH